MANQSVNHLIKNSKDCRVLMDRHCHEWPRLTEFSGVVLSSFALSHSTISMKLSWIKLEGLLTTIVHSNSVIQCHRWGVVSVERLVSS